MDLRIAVMVFLLLIANPAAADIWRCSDGSFTSAPRKDQVCELLSGSTRCVKGGYRAISAKAGVSESCARVSPEERAKLERQLLHAPPPAYRAAATKSKQLNPMEFAGEMPSTRGRGGAQVSAETYRSVSGTNPFSGSEGIERLRRVAGESSF